MLFGAPDFDTLVMDNKQSSKVKNQKMIKPVAASKNPAKRAGKNAKHIAQLDEAQRRALEIPEIDKIIMSVAAPSESEAVRMSGGFSAFPTALGKLFYEQKPAFGDYITAGNEVSTAAFAFRDPFRSFITLVDVTAGFAYQSIITTTISNGVSDCAFPGLFYLTGADRKSVV